MFYGRIIQLNKKFTESKLYHNKNAEHVSWTKVAKSCYKDFEDCEENIKINKSKNY